MKIFLSLLLFGGIFIINLSAQEKKCNIDYEIKNDSICFVKTKNQLIYKKELNNISSSIFFSLISKDEKPFLHFQFFQKSQNILPTSCINHKSIIALKLQNGRIINTYYIGDEKCSKQTADSETQSNIYILAANFIIQKEDLSYLQESPVTIVQIRFANTTEQITVQKESDSEAANKETLPAYFFINHIPCIMNNHISEIDYKNEIELNQKEP